MSFPELGGKAYTAQLDLEPGDQFVFKPGYGPIFRARRQTITPASVMEKSRAFMGLSGRRCCAASPPDPADVAGWPDLPAGKRAGPR